jgi:ferrous iron transport protein A
MLVLAATGQGAKMDHCHRGQGRPAQAATESLSTWLPGEEGVVVAADGAPAFAARLREMGFLPGEPVRLLRAGCPLIVQIGDSRLGLRRRDAALIRVRRASAVSDPRACQPQVAA